jgi:hypothetical protein
MATKYDRVNPWQEKLKRLYNCPRMVPDDVQYLNIQFERYKLRSFHIVCLTGIYSFIHGNLPIVKATSNLKYWSSLIVCTYSLYKWLLTRNNEHFEQIYAPFFEKYKVK